MSISDELRVKGGALWRKAHSHPFIKGIGDGSLPLEKFRYYIIQDYLFLIEYSRVLALASAKADNLDDMSWLAGLLHSTLNVEMDLHRKFAGKLGISSREFDSATPSPTTHAYTRYLLTVSYGGTLAEVTAALLPCQWGYSEIGQTLAQRGEPRNQPLYAQWVRMYASQEFAALAQRLRQMVDLLGQNASQRERQRMEEAFLTSSRYEYKLWGAAWKQERWTI